MKWFIILLACSLLAGCCSADYYDPAADPLAFTQSPAWQGQLDRNAAAQIQNQMFLDQLAAQRTQY